MDAGSNDTVAVNEYTCHSMSHHISFNLGKKLGWSHSYENLIVIGFWT